MVNTNIGISNFVSTQSPFFVRNDHPTFVKFLEAYYQYLEQEGKTIERAKGFRSALDVDRSIDLYTEKLYSQFLSLLPEETIADKNLIIKHIKDFYRARGTEKSIQFLMSILYDEDTTFYYPKRDILKASDGKWYLEKSLKVFDVKVQDRANANLYFTPSVFEVKNFTGRQVRGLTSNASATVESVDVYYETGVVVNELKISNQERDFIAGEVITASYEDEGFVLGIKANVYSGIIARVDILERGNNYVVGEKANVESNTGTGAVIVISEVTRAAIKSISPLDGGAGFQNSNIVLVTGGGGFDAEAQVASINADESVHPNSYNIIISLISAEANTPIGNSLYANLNTVVTDPANAFIANSMVYFLYGNTGPIQRVSVTVGGNNYTGNTILTAEANTRIKNLGILGKMRIVSPGSGYQANDEIEFINVPFAPSGFGVGARGYVETVNGTGAIQTVKFKKMPGHYVGGSGYSMDYLPSANIITSTGVGGNVIVTATLGEGEVLTSVSDDIGSIVKLTIVSGGTGYKTAPTINLQGFGSGTAQAVATVVQGVFTYPGRYLNDDGHLSSFNFLQDGRYYHNYSYVVRIKQAISKYRKALKDLVHPAGMSLFGEYISVDEGDTMNVQVAAANQTYKYIYYVSRPYSMSNTTFVQNINSSNLEISMNTYGLQTNSPLFIEFASGNGTSYDANGTYYVENVVNGNYVIAYSGTKLPASLNVKGHGISSTDVFFRPDGKKMYVAGLLAAPGDYSRVLDFSLDYPWDITSAKLSTQSDPISESIYGIHFKPDGSILYASNNNAKTIVQYNLPISWNANSVISTFSYNVSAQEGSVTAVSLHPNGTFMYVTGTANNKINMYSLGTSWNVATANYVSNLSVVSQETSTRGMTFKPDGTQVYVLGLTSDRVIQYTMSIPWNINTAVYNTRSLAITTFEPTGEGIRFSEDGKTAYFTGTEKNIIYQMPLRESWNAATIILETFGTTANTGLMMVGKKIT